jgi:RimJ/RimL family protein N-acetyltransferase
MSNKPELLTPRLRLRAVVAQDLNDVYRLAGAREIAATTGTIPHPYTLTDAENFIDRMQKEVDCSQGVILAIAMRESNKLIGTIGLHTKKQDNKAELGYWVGVPFWNQGFATEAAKALVNFGFEELGYRKITARHFAINPSSGRVMEKLGMKKEGYFAKDEVKNGRTLDVVYYGLLREEWRVGWAELVLKRSLLAAFL